MTGPKRAKPFLMPEEEELEKRKAELSQLEAGLYEAEVEIATLQAELQAFERRYLRVVGIKIAELDEVEAQIVELLSRRRPQDADAKAAADRARSRARESSQASATGKASRGPAEFEPSAEMKRLYRDVAKRVHPDLATNPTERERRTTLMACANAAYASGDINSLTAILHDSTMSSDAVQGEGVAFELVRVLRKIAQVRRRLEAIKQERAAVCESDMCRLKERVEKAEENEHDMLGDIAQQLTLNIETARDRLRRLKEARPI